MEGDRCVCVCVCVYVCVCVCVCVLERERCKVMMKEFVFSRNTESERVSEI
jgi:hypothetical protein